MTKRPPETREPGIFLQKEVEIQNVDLRIEEFSYLDVY